MLTRRYRDAVDLDVAGRIVSVTSPDKVMFPQQGQTKLDVIDYYRAVEHELMGAIRGRPVLMQRFPNGVDGSSFFQKRVPKDAPEWLETSVVSTPNGTTSDALVAADLAHIIWAVNLGLPRLPRLAQPRVRRRTRRRAAHRPRPATRGRVRRGARRGA